MSTSNSGNLNKSELDFEIMESPLRALNDMIVNGVKDIDEDEFAKKVDDLNSKSAFYRENGKTSAADWIRFGVERLIEWKSSGPRYTMGNAEHDDTKVLCPRKWITACSVVCAENEFPWNKEIQSLLEKRRVSALINVVIDKVLDEHR